MSDKLSDKVNCEIKCRIKLSDKVTFSDKVDWTTNISVWYLEDTGAQLSDNEEIDWMFQLEKDMCEDHSFRTTGILCYDFVSFDNPIIREIDGHHAITISQLSFSYQHYAVLLISYGIIIFRIENVSIVKQI